MKYYLSLILLLGITQFFGQNSCFIYNRWGAIIWENHNHEIGWDGKDANGFDITQGTYTWKIILKSPYSDNRKAYVGHLNLLR